MKKYCGLLIVVFLLFGVVIATSQVKQDTQVEIQKTKAFKFFDQTFQVPDSWPSEVNMKILPMEKMTEGNMTEYAFIQESYPGNIVYWFIGIKVNSEFTTKMLTQTMMLPGIGTIGCKHWIINPDGTITQLGCEEFGELIESLINGTDRSI